MRRGSVHDKSAIAHREAAMEAQRLQESMSSMTSLRDDDEDDTSGAGSPPAGSGGATESPSLSPPATTTEVRLFLTLSMLGA